MPDSAYAISSDPAGTDKNSNNWRRLCPSKGGSHRKWILIVFYPAYEFKISWNEIKSWLYVSFRFRFYFHFRFGFVFVLFSFFFGFATSRRFAFFLNNFVCLFFLYSFVFYALFTFVFLARKTCDLNIELILFDNLHFSISSAGPASPAYLT